MQKIKLGIIGMGRMGITHYSLINSHPDVEIDSVADLSVFALNIINKYLPITTFKNYNDLLSKRHIDAVLVCTPPNLHFPIIQKAFEKNVHVFVEKPFTTNLQEASKLSNTYGITHLVNQVG